MYNYMCDLHSFEKGNIISFLFTLWIKFSNRAHCIYLVKNRVDISYSFRLCSFNQEGKEIRDILLIKEVLTTATLEEPC